MLEDPYSDPATGVLYNRLRLGTAAELEAAEREITHAALILLDSSPVSPSYDLAHLQEIHRRISVTSTSGRAEHSTLGDGHRPDLPQG